MNIDAFTEQLRQEGFAEISTIEREPNGALGDHTHPFEAKAMIVDGETLTALAMFSFSAMAYRTRSVVLPS